jgi:hypothetical protein
LLKSLSSSLLNSVLSQVTVILFKCLRCKPWCSNIASSSVEWLQRYTVLRATSAAGAHTCEFLWFNEQRMLVQYLS